MSLHSLNRRLNLMLAHIDRQLADKHLPAQFLDDAGNLVYETPACKSLPLGVFPKLYIGFDPDEDGIEP